MDIMVKAANGFTGIFSAGGSNLVGLITGILPNVLVLLTFINALTKIIGEKRVNAFTQKITRFRILRYTLVPFIAMFFFANPMCNTVPRFVEEKYKTATIDAIFKFAHPVTGLFQHANAGEIFVWMGIASGVAKLGLNTQELAVRYLIVGLIAALIGGCTTEIITGILSGRKLKKEL